MTLNNTNITIIRRLLGGKNTRPLRGILSKLSPSDLASLFNHLSGRETNLFVDALIALDNVTTVLLQVPYQKLTPILSSLDKNKLLVILNYSSEDEAAEILSLLHEDYCNELLDLLDPKRSKKLKLILSYPENSAGRIMNTTVFSLPANMKCSEATELLRSYAQEESIYYIYCTSEDANLIGVISLRELVTAPANLKLSDLHSDGIISVGPETKEEEVAQIFEKYNFIAVPVVNEQNKLLGIVTVDEILDVIQDQVTSDIYASAGLQEDDRVYSTATRSIKNRLPWMAFNLILAAYVSSVVSLFEKTMSEVIILATLNNIVAGMGGNTGIQTLTVFTRGIARGDFQFISYSRAVFKEVTVGLINGVVTGVLAAVLVYFWKDSAIVGIIICISMILNSLVATTVGSLVPVLLKKLNFDPAAGSGVIVTMITDSFGFFSFLGIASLGLKHFGHL
ncbi:MAG: magnesium transporter [Bdellovibrionaceae bacterium]|nr:magnesium transporter [Pseudobdellovibrionaceae bacterium]|tara:strand:- start:17637 stop:18992 length:1356 start_codon:yes stop_codon:yes gene_type:complete